MFEPRPDIFLKGLKKSTTNIGKEGRPSDLNMYLNYPEFEPGILTTEVRDTDMYPISPLLAIFRMWLLYDCCRL